MTNRDIIIDVKHLEKRFGEFIAVNRINFQIQRGEILGFLGPNGAGKTTTIKMINGLLSISGGDIVIDGFDAVKQRKKIKKRMGYMSQKFSLYPTLTAMENIVFFCGISGFKKEKIKQIVSDASERIPADQLYMKIAILPPGIRQRVALFVATLTDPTILFLDEPTSGVDPGIRRLFWSQIYQLKEQGKTVLVSTHNLDEVEYADRIIILHKGNIIESGSPDRLRDRYNADNMETVFKTSIKEYEKTESGN